MYSVLYGVAVCVRVAKCVRSETRNERATVPLWVDRSGVREEGGGERGGEREGEEKEEGGKGRREGWKNIERACLSVCLMQESPCAYIKTLQPIASRYSCASRVPSHAPDWTQLRYTLNKPRLPEYGEM